MECRRKFCGIISCPRSRDTKPKESIDLNEQLQTYFEYVENVWRLFVPDPLNPSLREVLGSGNVPFF